MERRSFLQGAAATGLLLPLRSDARHTRRPLAEPIPVPAGTHAEALFPFAKTDIKFRMEEMMGQLSDANHENWRFTAYPDKHQPNVALIGAGFNLSVEKAIERTPGDPTDPYQYNGKLRLEPSSAQLWEGAGLSEQKREQVMERFARNKKRFGRNSLAYAALDAISPDISKEDATRLLYVSTRHAIHNAMAYAKDFPDMTASQQMGMSQLVYQMGSHLAPWVDEKGEQHTGFQNFLDAVNDTSFRQVPANSAQADPKAAEKAASEHWENAQRHLIDSQWFKLYRTRAVQVVAQFDPHYDANRPEIAEEKVIKLAAEMKKEHWHMDSPVPGFTDREIAKPDTKKQR